jgi:hypothetical protein
MIHLILNSFECPLPLFTHISAVLHFAPYAWYCLYCVSFVSWYALGFNQVWVGE